jgi:hypothetical protein
VVPFAAPGKRPSTRLRALEVAHAGDSHWTNVGPKPP